MKEEKICPSSIGKKGASLLGVVNDKGKIDLLENPIPLTEGFLFEANQGRSPEKRFRFSNKCVESGCKQWNGKQCGVIESVLDQMNELVDAIPNCSIRDDCRWFSQRGFAACKVCTLVITDVR